MKLFWNDQKNAELKEKRGVCFEDITAAIEAGGLLDIIEHKNRLKYPNQMVLVVVVDGYVCAAPFVVGPDGYFLKTAFRDRKLHARYKGETPHVGKA